MLRLDPEARPRASKNAKGDRPDLQVVQGKRRPHPTRIARILVRRSLTLFGLGSILAVAGCGGNGHDPTQPNLYRGDWNGTWTSATFGDNGTLSFTVYADGSMTGTMTRTRPATNATLVGTLDANGIMTALAGFGPDGNFEIQGAAVLTNNLLGSFRFTYKGVDYNASFSCVPAAGG
ncbi:MAG TPA: hypothetical protein PLL78_01815 [Fimbriimonadaceae bacterium]|nr:hypothetical protein [Fimbriimonadaceae bacterium]HRJ95394.1 hypothetical protein [Fimbriimonadaceae bacterium]